MPVEIQIIPFSEYLPDAIWFFFKTALGIGLLALVVSYLVAAIRFGPLTGARKTWDVIARMAVGVGRISPRRVWALSRLAMQEAVRRRVLVVVIVFAVVLLCAGWFLDTTSPDPGKLYISFVLWSTSFLVLLLALFLSTFSLPADVKNRTIQTVVTKPVRAGEIVLGRIIGFSAIGTLLLVAMGLSSYVFVVRGLNHTHELTGADLHELPAGPLSGLTGKEGQTSVGGDHRHEVTLDAAGNGWTNVAQGHRHFVTADTIVNDFEEFSGNAPKSWQIVTGTLGTMIGPDQDPARVEWGFSALKLTGDGKTPIEISRPLPKLTGGTKYHLTCWVQGDEGITAGDLLIHCAARDYAPSAGEQIEINTATLAALSRYRLYSATVDVPAQPPDDFRLVVSIKGALTAGKSVWLDGLQFSDQSKFTVGPPEDLLTARVPIYGQLRFRDRTGADMVHGISVGAEWGYRSFIDGGTVAAAIWKFKGLKREDFPQGLPIDMSIRVFRTYKGIIGQAVRGTLVLRHPVTGRSSKIHVFRAKDNTIDHWQAPLKLLDSGGNPIDLFDDLVYNGELEVWLQCLEPEQYFGVAQADLYLRHGDGTFESNLFKAYVGIWVQMVLVTAFGVMFSTFLSAPVALLATSSAMLLGFHTRGIINLANSVLAKETVKVDDFVPGGGPIEALIRIVRQENVTRPLEPSVGIHVAQAVDHGILYVMRTLAQLLPDFGTYNDGDYVTHGFSIPGDLVGTHLVSALGYLAVVFVAGYLFLRTREVAK